MNKTVLDNFIHVHAEELKASDEWPLLGYNQPPIAGPLQSISAGKRAKTTFKKPPYPLSKYKNFKSVAYQDIVEIRLNINQNQLDENGEEWCRKLLRYIEIRYSVLQRNEKKTGRDKVVITKLFTQVLALFVEYYQKTKDIIYLNAALKVLDLSWIKPSSSLLPTSVLYQRCEENIEKSLKQLTNG